ncbi:ThuA domain-containing protein [Microbacterium aquimaris]|uniref:ThuA domain-containing protein n=1 Tax=Microbacterium aquimaris TaxID=459816 RepID=A0ABU5N327_9MICO|nr:ThuA domain-containing protein [Microbacterium aquimaris]MDZ8160332.1 ThuA domain-containing protein [Microbacterium aquimaris]
MKALIASGTGHYADPWHPFPETTPELRAILTDAGFVVDVDEDVDHAMARLDGFDLLVVNAGDPWRGEDAVPAPRLSVDGLSRALDRGMGVLALHCAVASMRDYPDWAAAIGGMWVPQLSWHPPAGEIDVRVHPFPDGDALSDFTVFDEQYARLQAIGRREVVAEFTVDGERMPAAWVRTYGASRIAVDVLGHDARSYASAGHRNLVKRLARWATAA